MSRPGSLPPVLVAALRAPEGKCYRHCERPARTRRLPSPLPGLWQVLACPSGVVSLTSYSEWTRRDPSSRALAFLRRHTMPASLVRPHDLRLASRHGPELGRRAEGRMARDPGRRPVRVVYWRVYPFRAADGKEHRLFVCYRRTHRGPVFYAAPTEEGAGACPACARRRRGRAHPRTRTP